MAVPLPLRRAIWLALGPKGGEGQRRRVALGQAAVRHVLPLWDAVHPDDNGPLRMLALADRVLRGETNPEAARREQDEFAVEVQDLEDDDRGPVMSATPRSIRHTARIDYGPDDFEPDRLDEQLDATSGTPATTPPWLPPGRARTSRRRRRIPERTARLLALVPGRSRPSRLSPPCLEQPTLRRQRHGLSPILGAQLVENRVHMKLHGPLGDRQRRGDLLGRQSFGDQP